MTHPNLGNFDITSIIKRPRFTLLIFKVISQVPMFTIYSQILLFIILNEIALMDSMTVLRFPH